MTVVIKKQNFEFSAPELLFKNLLALEIRMLPDDLRLAIVMTLLFEMIGSEEDIEEIVIN
jgi:hypothetical protein